MVEINRIGDKPTITLDDYRALRAREEAVMLIVKDVLDFWGYKPPTRWQRFKTRLPFWRIRDAWRVLIGKADAV